MDGRCGTCRHWQPDTGDRNKPPVNGCCMLITHGESKGAYLENGDYAATLARFLPNRDWGCVEHEPKDDTP